MWTTLPDILDLVPSHGIGLEQLAALASEALVRRGVVIEDGRASVGVDGRTVRFYQTLGIVPKPSYEGRRAIYDREHLVRVIAAKTLQSEGYSLAAIQSALATRSTAELAQLLQSLGSQPSLAPGPSLDSPPTDRAGARPADSADGSRSPSDSAPPPTVPVAVVPFQLAPGVLVLIDPRHATDPTRLASELSEALARSAFHRPAPPVAPTMQPHRGRENRDGRVGGPEPSPDPSHPDHGGKR